jgi:hypothetical protein
MYIGILHVLILKVTYADRSGEGGSINGDEKKGEREEEGMDLDGQAGEDDEEEAQLAWARVIRLSDWQSAGHLTPPPHHHTHTHIHTHTHTHTHTRTHFWIRRLVWTCSRASSVSLALLLSPCVCLSLKRKRL